jgi:hypothetical protein
MMVDYTLLTYVLEFGLCSLAFVVFLFWLIYKWHTEKSRPSDIYIFFTALFASRAYSVFMGIQARMLRDDSVAYYDFMNGMLWHTRNVFELIILSVIVWKKTRMILMYFLFPDYNRRAGDKDDI